MRVYVYWNLNRDCFSIKALDGGQKGRVVGHAYSVELSDVTFTVGAAGRAAILAGGHKSVHAGMRGTLLSTLPTARAADRLRAITYNPRKHATFVYRDNLEPIHTAARVIGLTVNGRADCYAS